MDALNWATALPLIAIGPCTDPQAVQALAEARARLAQAPGYRALMFVSSNAVLHFLHDPAPAVAAERPGAEEGEAAVVFAGS